MIDVRVGDRIKHETWVMPHEVIRVSDPVKIKGGVEQPSVFTSLELTTLPCSPYMDRAAVILIHGQEVRFSLYWMTLKPERWVVDRQRRWRHIVL